MNLPYPQLDNGNIYDKLYHYSSLEVGWDYIQNQFYDTVLDNKYFDFWGAELDYQPNQEIFGGPLNSRNSRDPIHGTHCSNSRIAR